MPNTQKVVMSKRKTRVKKNSPPKTIWCDRLCYSIFYGFCPSEEDWYAEQREMKLINPVSYPKTPGCCTVFHNVLCTETDPGKTICLVTFNDPPSGKQSYASLMCSIIHESIHVFQAMMAKAYEDKPGDEIEAYTIAHIAMELYRAYIRTRPEPDPSTDFEEIRKYYKNTKERVRCELS